MVRYVSLETCPKHVLAIQKREATRSKVRRKYTQPAITCSRLTIETLEQGVKHV